MVHHLVLFTLDDPADRDEAVAVLRGMQGRIPTLRGVEVGVDERPSPRSAHIALLTHFDDWEGLDAYAVHPHHVDVVLAHMGRVVAEAKKVDWQDAR